YGPPPAVPRARGRQRALPGYRTADSTAHRAGQAELGGGGVSGGGARIPSQRQLDRRVPADSQVVRGNDRTLGLGGLSPPHGEADLSGPLVGELERSAHVEA